MSASSLRSLAEKLDLSHATVSAALNGKAGVKPSTRAKVLAAAEALGYRANPLASALMGELRRSRGGVFRGTLALVSLAPEAEARASAHALYEQAASQGAAQRAEQLGFKLDRMRVSRPEADSSRTVETIAARGIRGIILTHEAGARLAGRLDWTNLTGILLGVSGSGTGLNMIGPDHHAAMAYALERIQVLGYSRPGLVLDASSPAPVLHRWEAAYHAGRLGQAETTSPRPLIAGPGDRERFGRWLSDGGFDVVLAHHALVLDWMRDWIREAGSLAPKSPGFCSLDLLGAAPEIAGLDLRASAIGARAIDLLTGQVLRNETGLPEFPVATLIPPAWVHGETLRVPDNLVRPHVFTIPAAQEKRIA